MEIKVQEDIMAVNDQQAQENRRLFQEKHICCVNILGSPGAGKTTLLERILGRLPHGLQAAVIEGDLATAKDAARIAGHGVAVVQINTDGGCHLDARMISRVLPAFDLDATDLLIIENVGNLVCPASFDLGEAHRIVVLSLAEGGDKPLKYPATFLSADTVILNKLDLAPYVDAAPAQIETDLRSLKPDLRILSTACRAGAESGLDAVADLLAKLAEQPCQ